MESEKPLCMRSSLSRLYTNTSSQTHRSIANYLAKIIISELFLNKLCDLTSCNAFAVYAFITNMDKKPEEVFLL